jgi:voltage-gated potassium channel Kch
MRNLVAGVAFMACVIGIATLAYASQGWSLGDAFYMVILTVYTVGYDEVHPIDTTALRAITIFLIVTGCTGMIFLTGSLIQLITVSQFQSFFGIRRMQRDIDRLKNHVIICGYGRIGQSLAADLKAGGQDFVVLDLGDTRLDAARMQNYLAIQGDATNEDVLRQAGIERARALATVLPDDAANVFITLSARSLNKDLTIIARGELPSTEPKLIQAGADRVVLPAHIGAERMAELLLFKTLGHVRDTQRMAAVTAELERIGLDFEIVAVAAGSKADGATIAEVERRGEGSFLIVAIEQASGATIFQPPLSTRLVAGTGVAVVGRPTRTEAMVSIFSAGA